MYQLLKQVLFPFRISERLLRGINHAQRIESGAGADEARFARDTSLVDCGREALRVRKAVEGFAPRFLVRGSQEDTVNVENDRR